MPTLTSYFNDMDDPRGGNAPRHKFCDLMTISLLCALCGGETAVDMELFGQMKENFLREFLELPHGIPCHDAYSRLFRLMKPTSFHAFFDKFRADFATGAGDAPAIAIDGKEMRRSFDKAAARLPYTSPWTFRPPQSLRQIKPAPRWPLWMPVPSTALPDFFGRERKKEYHPRLHPHSETGALGSKINS